MKSAVRYLASELPVHLREKIKSASFFASPDFLAIWHTRKGKAVYWCYEDNGVTTILSGVEFGNGLLTRFQSLPDGLYSKLFSFQNSSLVTTPIAHIDALLVAIAQHSYLKMWIYDYRNCIQNSAEFVSTPCETHLIDIAPPSWEPPDATLRSEIRKAERENIQIERFNEEKHFESFLVLMRNTESRHGREPKYADDFFQALAQLTEIDPRVIWKQCMFDGKAAASHIFFIEGSLALHWQVYFDKEFSNLKPNQAILFQTIRELQHLGIKTLSLGASPSDAEGLRSYKERWGGVPYHYQQLYRASWLGKLV